MFGLLLTFEVIDEYVNENGVWIFQLIDYVSNLMACIILPYIFL